MPKRKKTPAAAAPAATADFPAQSKSVAAYSSRQAELVGKSHLPRTLMAGTQAMRDAGETYTPKHPNEPQPVYQTRLKGTYLYNAYKNTVKRQAGKLFGRPVVLTDKVPETIKTFAENVDGQDRAITPFSMDMCVEAWRDGIAYILVDYPTLAPGASLADAQRAGAEPYWCLVTQDQVLGMQSEQRGGKQVLTQVRIKTCTIEKDPADPYKEIPVERVRVLVPGGFAVYRKDKNDKQEEIWILESSGTTTLDYIPLVPMYINRVGFMEGEPPLSAAAELNLEHWVSSSEQRNALTFARFAMLKLKGVKKPEPRRNKEGAIIEEAPEGITVGPAKVLYLPENGDAAFVEHTGAGIGAGRQDIQDIETRMRSSDMEVRVEHAGEVTATSTAIDSQEANAAMKAVAQSLKDCLETALQYTADWKSEATGGEVETYNKFGETTTEVTLDQLLKMRAQREISRDTFWGECLRRGILAEDFDADAEKVLLDADLAEDMDRLEETIARQADAGGPHPGNNEDGTTKGPDNKVKDKKEEQTA